MYASRVHKTTQAHAHTHTHTHTHAHTCTHTHTHTHQTHTHTHTTAALTSVSSDWHVVHLSLYTGQILFFKGNGVGGGGGRVGGWRREDSGNITCAGDLLWLPLLPLPLPLNDR